ncbi:hypothetical protein JKF63_00747 [Porcisia hertigi]|uniref:Guanine nucleotide-binding protein subunit beta-like protein n=1 Tax=Porcisia hertigi TaxID=2761500 RepID=A0A836KXC6_9TRYP|nr:hypothetical protein JKF63_00747 [Porcisia hertigi]
MELDNLKEDVLMGDTNEVTVPAAVVASAPVLDIGFHPRLPILAAGLVTGEIEIFERKSVDEMVKVPLQNDFSSWIFNGQYKEDEVLMNYHHQNMLMHPSGGVSSMEFTDDGAYLVSASGDRTISVMDCVSLRLVIHIPSDEVQARTAGKKKLNAINKKNDPTVDLGRAAKKKATSLERCKKSGYTVPVNPHKYGISSLNVCDENLIATGDDDGLVAVWDMRERKPVHTYHEHGDYVSQLCYFTDAQELVSSSGDTCLGAYDMRAGKIRDFSVRRKDELNCFAFINSSGIGNTAFIPSIVCGTPHGGLPIWKYGSWTRPYDVMESHPAECEAIISFHGENTTFNHNLILTGACDGLVRVLQMYPVRRNLCQLSARDYTYSHSSVLGIQSSSSGHQHQGNYVVRRARGQEAISRMRVSHDANLLAVSGHDNIIDFVDISFMNDESELDQLRGRAEQRHLRTLRELDRERDEEEEREHLLMGGRGTDGDDDNSNGDELSSDSSTSRSSSQSSEDNSQDFQTGEARQVRLDQREALRQKLERIRSAPKRRAHSDSSSSDGEAHGNSSRASEKKAPARSEKTYAEKVDKTTKSKRGSAATPLAPSQDNGARLPAKIPQSAGCDISDRCGTRDRVSFKKAKHTPATDTTPSVTNTPTGTNVASSVDAEAAENAMEVYRTERQKKRERAAAARWLKEERRKKINFAFEKRRRRVGGFFGDMARRDDDSD